MIPHAKDNPLLFTKLEPYVFKLDKGGFDMELVAIARKLYDALEESEDGVAIAANQIGIPVRAFFYGRMITNPLIIKKIGSVDTTEGCLSYPGVVGEKKRAKRIIMQFYNMKGARETLTLDGTAAIVCQHEIDHLDGIAFHGSTVPLSTEAT